MTIRQLIRAKLLEESNLPRKMYSGTSRTQLEAILAGGMVNELYLADVEDKSWDYAERQAMSDDSELAMLVVDPSKLVGDLRVDAGSNEEEWSMDMGQWVYSGELSRDAILMAYYVDDDSDEKVSLL